MEETKICRMCGEQIKAIAKRCPHCTHFQSKLNAPTLIVIIGVVIIFGSQFMLKSTFDKETLYDPSNKLNIVETKQLYSTEDCGSFITILGEIKNETDKTWNNLHFEVIFFNDKNELIDTLNSQAYSLVIAANKTASFRLRGKAASKENQYARYEIKISKASEDFGFF